jgi:hypothetical protein
MVERVIEAVVRIVAAGVVSDPMVVMVHVRRVRMTGQVGLTMIEAAAVWRVSDWSRTVRRNVAAAEAGVAAAGVAHAAAARAAATTTSPLRKGGLGNDQEYDERSKKLMHCSSGTCDGKGDARRNHEIGDC